VSPDAFATEWIEAWDSHDVDRILTFYTDDAFYEDVPNVENGWAEPMRGHEMIRESLVETFEEMSDLGFEFVSASAAGDRLVVEWIMTGTHYLDYSGRFSIRGVSVITLEGDKIARVSDYYDAYLLLSQLGIVSPLGGEDSTSSVPLDDSVEIGNGEVVRAVFSEIWSQGNVEFIPDLFSEDFVGHFPGGNIVHGREGLAAEVIAHREAFPDWTEVVDDEIIDRDRVAVRFTSRGTNTGGFLGNPPTGNRVEISEVAIFRLMDGKIAEQWVYPDILSIQRQLNVKYRQ
jgi:steroid delta-isomerase-like uncharacterized protein